MLKWSCLELAINCSDDRTAPLLRPRDWVSFPFLVCLALPTLCPLWTPLASYFPDSGAPLLIFFSSAMFTVVLNVEQYCHLWQEIIAFPGHWFKDQDISSPVSYLTLMIPLFWQESFGGYEVSYGRTSRGVRRLILLIVAGKWGLCFPAPIESIVGCIKLALANEMRVLVMSVTLGQGVAYM